MAATTISHNKPTAGSISWTAFNISYAGGNYSIPADNSAAKYVWWEYNKGVPRLREGDVLPTLTPDDTVLFLNKKGIGVLLPESTILDGSLIVEESIYAAAIAADQIESKHIKSDAIETQHIAANAVTAEQLSVGTVSANLVSNGSFEDYDADGNIIGWQANAMTGGTMAPVTGVASSGRVSIQLDATAITANLRLGQRPDQYIPVSNASGRKWYVSARMGAGTAITKGMYIRVNWLDANRAWMSSTDVQSNRPLTTTFTVYEGQATPPANARYMGMEIILNAPNVVTKMYLDEVTAHEVIVAANIGDGQITTPKLVSKSVTADKLVIRDTSNFLTDGSFEADGSGWALNGNTIQTLAAAQIRDGAVGTKVLQIVASSAVQEATADSVPAEAGDWYYASCYVRSTVASTSTAAAVGLAATVIIDGAGNQYPAFQNLAANKITSTWTLVEGKIKLPPKTLSFNLRLQVRETVTNGTFQFDDVTLRRMNGGELIVDGAVKTNHVTTNSLSGDVIAANTIVGGKLIMDSITSRELKATEIWADSAWINAISGKRIVGASIGTDANGFRGVQITPTTGIRVHNDTGLVVLAANRDGVSARGDFTTSSTTGSVEMSSTIPGEAVPTRLDTAISFYGPESSSSGAELRGRLYSGYARDGVILQGPSGMTSVSVSSTRAHMQSTASRVSVSGSVVKMQGSGVTERRVPFGVLDHWKSTTQINLTNQTQICSRTVMVPAGALIRITLHLRGYGNANNQVTQLDAYAAGALFGYHNNYTSIADSAEDHVAVFHYDNQNTTDKSIVFKLTGTTVVPSTSTFVIPAVTTSPQVQVVIEDLGTLP